MSVSEISIWSPSKT